MSCLLPGLLIVAVVTAVSLVVAHQQSQLQRRNAAFRRLAHEYHGRYEDSDFFRFPTAHFHYNGTLVWITIYSTGGKHPTYYLQARLRVPDSHFRCEVYPEGFFNRMGKLFGMQDIPIGSPYFDDTFIIQGNDPAEVRAFLNPGVQAQILRLAAMGDGDAYVSFAGGWADFRSRGIAYDYPHLLSFTHAVLALYDQTLATAHHGIEFIDERELQSAELAAICQVCGEEISFDTVHCVSCGTSHHRECWEYFGACSTYGCSEKRYRLPAGSHLPPKRW